MRIMAYSPHEPDKRTVLAWVPGQPVQRAVDVVIRDHERRLTVEALVSLPEGEVTLWRERGDVQPALTYPEVFAAMQAAYDDSTFQQALARRGLTDPGSVVLFPWTAGNWGLEDSADRGRLIRLQATMSQGPEDNYYARPLEGLIVTVELDRMAVRIDDYGVIPLPTHSGNYTPAGITDPGNVPYFAQGTRTDLKPIEITQPEGVSFQANGHRSAGRNGVSVWVSPRARAWCSIWWSTSTREGGAPSSTEPLFQKCMFHMGTPVRHTTSRMSLTQARSALGYLRTAWSWDATV